MSTTRALSCGVIYGKIGFMETKIKTALRQKMFLALLGLVLFVILLETGLRLGAFILSTQQARRNNASLSRTDTYRILCLGESTTQGEYPPFLEEALNRRAAGIKFSVIDKGAGGTTTGAIVSQLEANLDRYKPNMVITMMGINDSAGHLPPEEGPPEEIALLLKSLRVYKLARLLWLHCVTSFKKMSPHMSPDFKDDKLFIQLGLHYLAQDDIDGARQAFKEALRLNSKNPFTYVKLGRCYRELGDYAQAEQTLLKATELDPHNDRAYLALGFLFKYQAKLDKAAQALKKSIEANPGNTRARTELALLCRDLQAADAAEQELLEAIKFSPVNPLLFVELGWTYRSRAKYAEAQGAFEKAMQLAPRDPAVHMEAGWFYHDQGEHERSRELFARAFELAPQDDVAYREFLRKFAGMAKDNRVEETPFNSSTIAHYRQLKQILDRRKIRWVCVGYPMRSIQQLKDAFDGQNGVIFVDNEELFKSAVLRAGSREYFRDMFGGNFGHCTIKGNRLLAENIADAIFTEAWLPEEPVSPQRELSLFSAMALRCG